MKKKTPHNKKIIIGTCHVYLIMSMTDLHNIIREKEIDYGTQQPTTHPIKEGSYANCNHIDKIYDMSTVILQPQLHQISTKHKDRFHDLNNDE